MKTVWYNIHSDEIWVMHRTEDEILVWLNVASQDDHQTYITIDDLFEVAINYNVYIGEFD